MSIYLPPRVPYIDPFISPISFQIRVYSVTHCYCVHAYSIKCVWNWQFCESFDTVWVLIPPTGPPAESMSNNELSDDRWTRWKSPPGWRTREIVILWLNFEAYRNYYNGPWGREKTRPTDWEKNGGGRNFLKTLLGYLLLIFKKKISLEMYFKVWTCWKLSTSKFFHFQIHLKRKFFFLLFFGGKSWKKIK